MSALDLPRLTWGDPDGPRTLLIHGLGSSAATMESLALAFVADGWHVTAVDLRGHGLAPRASSYLQRDFVDDLLEVTADGGWDLVVGHSLGGAVAVLTSVARPDWARRLILIDPAILLSDEEAVQTRDETLENYRAARAGQIIAADSGWQARDIDLKQDAIVQLDPDGIPQIMANLPWDLRAPLTAVEVPTLILGADPQLGPLFSAELAAQTASEHITFVTVDGAGHSVHRDQPQRTQQAIRAWLG